MPPSIEQRIAAVFDKYRQTQTLLEEFASNRRNASELVILACSRLDALANMAMTQKKTQRERFVSFLSTFTSRGNELDRVALPNLYFYVFRQFVTLPGTIPAPGRLTAYDLARDATFLQFLVDSGVPLAEPDVDRMLHRISVWLQKEYRTTATQTRRKPHFDSAKNVRKRLEAHSSSYRRGLYD